MSTENKASPLELRIEVLEQQSSYLTVQLGELAVSIEKMEAQLNRLVEMFIHPGA